jgi:NAD-dependent DNA ligase
MNSSDIDEEKRYDKIHKEYNKRKREVYWIGFLEGAVSSKGIETGEEKAIHAEAQRFAKFFNDPDASDLEADLKARCFESDQDLLDQIRFIVAEKRAEVAATSKYSEADEMNEFLGFCAGIICDGKILQPEAEAILARFHRSPTLTNGAPFQNLRRALHTAMADRMLSDIEASETEEWISHLVGSGFIDTGLPNIGTVALPEQPITDPSLLKLRGSSFVLTGPMKMGVRSDIISRIERLGGAVSTTVRPGSDYVVVSLEASRHWLTTHFGNKIKKACELIDQGHSIKFVSEVALDQAIEKAELEI